VQEVLPADSEVQERTLSVEIEKKPSASLLGALKAKIRSLSKLQWALLGIILGFHAGIFIGYAIGLRDGRGSHEPGQTSFQHNQ
jgi:hypothetical protein